MEDFEKALGRLREGIERAKRLREQAAARKEVLEQQLREIEAEIRAHGVEPERLEEEIARLEAEARQALAEAEKLIPWELLQQAEDNRGPGGRK
jgi:septal ring factor EnvC (AmiA/AmiB activator)